MFKKRKQKIFVGGYNPPRVECLKTDDSGTREVAKVSQTEFRQLNPIDFTDFSLSEEMQAGVDIRQLPTSNILDANPDMSQEQILEALESQEKVTE